MQLSGHEGDEQKLTGHLSVNPLRRRVHVKKSSYQRLPGLTEGDLDRSGRTPTIFPTFFHAPEKNHAQNPAKLLPAFSLAPHP